MWGLFLSFPGAMLAFAPVIAAIYFFAPLYAPVPWVIRIGAFTPAPCGDFPLVLLRRDEHCGYLVRLWCIFVPVNTRLYALFKDVFPLNGEDLPVNGDTLVVQCLIKYSDYIVAHSPPMYVEGPPGAAVGDGD